MMLFCNKLSSSIGMEGNRLKRYRWIVWAIIVIMPGLILFSEFESQNGFLKLIHFGQHFQTHRLPEVLPFVPSDLTRWGYDGQFYAQIAIDPSLKHEELRQAVYGELDYRARRIGLPFLAFCLGMNDPFLILHAYSILNGLFWILLLITLHRYGNLYAFKGFLLGLSVLWSTGTLTSLARALPDLPAVVFIVWAFISKSQIKANILLGCAALFKETAILSILRVLLPRSSGYSRMIRQWIISFLIVSGPLLTWCLYIYVISDDAGIMAGTGNFALPLSGLLGKLKTGMGQLTASFAANDWLTFPYFFYELLCPISLSVQVIYLLTHCNPRSPVWNSGIGFVILFLFLGPNVWAGQYAYTRVLLPLTVSFNFLIHQKEKENSYGTWYIAGNLGMTWMCLEAIYKFLWQML